jgi:hypothetical protein
VLAHAIPVIPFAGYQRLRVGFGEVALKSQVDFPLETGVSIEFVVMIDGKRPTIDSVQFTAPRSDSTVSSIAAEIWVH